MKLNIKGEYTFHIPIQGMFLNETLKIKNNNLITLLGESFFMNRWINDHFQPITYIGLGKGTSRPVKTDTRLGKQTIQKPCRSNVNLDNKRLTLSATFETREIKDTTEIGVLTADHKLLTHDIYTPITSDILGDSISSIYLEYHLQLTTGGIRSNWKTSTLSDTVLYCYEPVNVISVMENNTGSGYVRVNALNELETLEGAFYYDVTSKNLYIHTTRSNTLSNIDEMEIIVQNK